MGEPATPTHAPSWSAMLAWWLGRDTAAVRAGGVGWSGDELLARASGAVGQLDVIGAPAGSPIPALFESSPTALAYVVGAAACHRPLAPLGPRLTSRDLAACVRGLGATLLLAEPAWETLGSEVAALSHCRLVVVTEPPAAATGRLDLDPDDDDVAFVLHTSGTTGSPKPVPYRQGPLARRVRTNAALCSLGPGCTYATASPFHHIAGFGNYAVAMAAGAAVVPVRRFCVESWTELAGFGVTHALCVPTMLEMLLDAGCLALKSLRVLQYGGSPIHPDTLRRTLGALPSVDLVNIFGQTEGSPITCLTSADHRRILTNGSDHLLASVGRAAPGVELRIEGGDASGVGEVAARAGHFSCPDPDGWLRTGDLGRLDGEGYLFLSGRRGDKIIRGGENIYPVEVEQVLIEHPAVREAAVIGWPDRRFGQIVKAFIVMDDPAGAVDADDLHRHARAHLAGFKVPTEWEVVATLPHNAAGKLIRRQLLPDSDHQGT